MRRNHGDKELDQLQKLKQENRILKKHVSALRKQLSRLDIDRYNNLKELVEKHYQEEQQIQKADLLDSLKKEWRCHEPACTGYLKLVIIDRRDGIFYYRKCTECPNRTRTKKYDENVQGIRE